MRSKIRRKKKEADKPRNHTLKKCAFVFRHTSRPAITRSFSGTSQPTPTTFESPRLSHVSVTVRFITLVRFSHRGVEVNLSYLVLPLPPYHCPRIQDVSNMSADEDNDCDSVQNRGVSTGKKLKSKKSNDLHIRFNEHGQPCGVNLGRFSSDMGVLARNIKITYRNWKKVPWGLKETIWNDAKRTWNLDDDKQKIVLKILSKAHKEFKSRLTRTYITKTIKPKSGKVVVDSPVPKYQQITKEDWEEFKKQRKEKSFLEISAKAQASQKMNEYPHFLGRTGYEGRKEKWYKEELALELERETLNGDPNPTLTEEMVESVTSRLSDRAVQWVKAHTPPSGTPPPQTKQVIDNFNRWKTLEQKGDYVPSRYEDALVKAIGKPEHPGRARGVGSYATLQSYFGKPSRSAQTYTEEDVRLLIEKVKKETMDEVKKETMIEVNAMMEKKWAEMMGKMSPVKGNGNVESSMMEPLPRGQVQSSCHSSC